MSFTPPSRTRQFRIGKFKFTLIPHNQPKIIILNQLHFNHKGMLCYFRIKITMQHKRNFTDNFICRNDKTFG